jgi:hypothetical protein
MNLIPCRASMTGIRRGIPAFPLILIALAAGFFGWTAWRSAYSCSPPPSGCTCRGTGVRSCTYDGQCGGKGCRTACGLEACGTCADACKNSGANQCMGGEDASVSPWKIAFRAARAAMDVVVNTPQAIQQGACIFNLPPSTCYFCEASTAVCSPSTCIHT